MRNVRLWIAVAALGVLGSPAVADEPWRLGTSLETPVLDEDAANLSFTPRLPGVFDLDSARVTLSYAPLQPQDERFSGGGRAVDGFAVGGALAVDRFVVEGALARATSPAGERERVDAAIGFGGFTTRMHLQDTESFASGASSTRFGIGADLTAAPGLSLGAGLNFSDNADGAEDDTAGVVRFRLQF
jgi:hypothetical protein